LNPVVTVILSLLLNKTAKGKNSGSGKKRAARGTLSKRQDLDRVHVEDTFQFNLPEHVAVSNDEGRKAGEGCYVSATVHNRRYYGVLIDQASLKAASMLYFQDEASGLELNRKMEHLLHLNRQGENDMDLGNDFSENKRKGVSDDTNSSSKRARLDAVPDPVSSNQLTKYKKPPVQKLDKSGQVQKYRYVLPSDDDDNTEAHGYRELIATFVDVAAAAEYNQELEQQIEFACRSGGNFVGKFYYQYEVLLLFLFVHIVFRVALLTTSL
jgi:hypothetical protein